MKNTKLHALIRLEIMLVFPMKIEKHSFSWSINGFISIDMIVIYLIGTICAHILDFICVVKQEREILCNRLRFEANNGSCDCI